MRGHILGSATVTLEITEGQGGEEGDNACLHTGDLGRKGAAVVRDPQGP